MKTNVTKQQDETITSNAIVTDNPENVELVTSQSDTVVCDTTEAELAQQADVLDVENTENITTKKVKAKKIARNSVSYLAKISLLTAIGVVLMILDFPILPAVPYLQLNFSDVPTLIASFMFGPISGIIVNGAKIGVNLLITSTSTNFVGPLSNLISGSLYALTAGVIYMLKKDKIGAIISLIVSSIVFCIAMWFTNQYLLLPAFGIKDHDAQMINLWWTLLFNVIKTTLTCVITMFIYKGTHKLFNKF